MKTGLGFILTVGTFIMLASIIYGDAFGLYFGVLSIIVLVIGIVLHRNANHRKFGIGILWGLGIVYLTLFIFFTLLSGMGC